MQSKFFNFRVSRHLIMFPIITLTTVLQFCSPKVATTSGAGSYYEDLSEYRTEYAAPDYQISDEIEGNVVTVEKDFVEPTNSIKAELDSVISIIVESKKDIKYLNGFSIQLYSGNNRDRAYDYRNAAREKLEKFEPVLRYEQPNYKVRIGEYYTRLEAQEDFDFLKQEFKRAVLVPTRIKVL